MKYVYQLIVQQLLMHTDHCRVGNLQ